MRTRKLTIARIDYGPDRGRFEMRQDGRFIGFLGYTQDEVPAADGGEDETDPDEFDDEDEVDAAAAEAGGGDPEVALFGAAEGAAALAGDTELGLTARNLLDRLPWESVPLGVRILLHRGARLARDARVLRMCGREAVCGEEMRVRRIWDVGEVELVRVIADLSARLPRLHSRHEARHRQAVALATISKR